MAVKTDSMGQYAMIYIPLAVSIYIFFSDP